MTSLFRLLGVILVLSVLTPRVSLGQKQYNIWYFGDLGGLDFNSGTPLPSPGGKVSTTEGSASICDDQTGSLLFYTDGITVWNRNHQAMPNGTGLLGDGSSTQSAMIIGVPDDKNQYFLFTCDQGGYAGPNKGINYNIVDMTLDGGLGDVVTKNVLLLPHATEKITAIRQPNSCNSWVIGHQFNSNAFYAWSVTDTGVSSTPVISNVGLVQTGPFGEAIGYLVATKDGKRLAQALHSSGNIELFDFDINTGQVSAPIRLPGFPSAYGLCFSPDGTKLYATEEGANELLQFNLTSSSPAVLVAGMTRVYKAPDGIMAIMPGPDGKLYVGRPQKPDLGVVANPNATGVACNFAPDGIPIAGICKLGFPNVCYSYLNVPSHSCILPDVHIASTSPACIGDCIMLKASIDNATTYRWELEGARTPVVLTEDPGLVCYDSAGKYKVLLIVTDAQGNEARDSQVMVVHNPTVVTLEAIGGRTDTIGGDVLVTLRITGGGPLTTGTMSFTLQYDISILEFGGYYSAGRKADTNTSPGIAEITLDSEQISNGQQLGYALFHPYPLVDSCSDVRFNNITLSQQPKQCVVLDAQSSNGVTATVCAPVKCATSQMSRFVRNGETPVWSVIQLDPRHLLIRYSHLLTDGRLTIVDAVGRPVLQEQIPAAVEKTVMLDVDNLSMGRYFATLTIPDGIRQSRGIIVSH